MRIIKYILKLTGSILLIVLALLLFVIVTIPAFLWKVFVSIKDKHRKATDIFNGTANYFVQIAASFDQLGNATFGGFFNWLFISKKEVPFYMFGDKDETISEVLGWNEMLGSLSKAGKGLVWFLNKLDKDHCKSAMVGAALSSEKKIKKYEKFIKKI